MTPARSLLLVAALLAATPAAAHSLRLFARVEGAGGAGAQVSGYGFFIGGGRPQGAHWVARMGAAQVAEGATDASGAFAFPAPAPVTAPLAITLDTGDGHMVQTTLPPERFGATPAEVPPAPASAPIAQPASPAPLPEAQIEAAVARQIAPLLERIEQMDARMRATDLISGLFLILGLAGMALWARGRK